LPILTPSRLAPFTRRMPAGQLGTRETGICSFVGQPANGGKADTDCGWARLFCSRKNRYRSTTARLMLVGGSEQYQPMNSSIA